MAISRMDMERQLRAGGGIMTLDEPRQGYFLGKIVKKAKRAVKKVTKSPLGKAALAGAAIYGLGGGTAFGRGLPFLKSGGGFSLANLGSNLGIGSITKGIRGQPAGFSFDGPLAGLFSKGGKFSLGRTALTGLGATALAAPFLMGGDDEEIDEGIDVSGIQPMVQDIRNQAKAYYQDPTKSALYFMPQKSAVQSSFYAAGGGLADIPRGGYAGGQLVSPNEDGSRPGYAGPLDFLKNIKSGLGQVFSGQTQAVMGGDQEKMNEFNVLEGYGIDLPKDKIAIIVDGFKRGLDLETISSLAETDSGTVQGIIEQLSFANGGRIGKAEGGIMDLGGLEKDYREGGFVPLGAEERADDVPARLSKNEFVFTADAVRNAGGGDIDKGAEAMQNMMDNLEAGGSISEESQGMENPAQEMFDQAQMMENRIA